MRDAPAWVFDWDGTLLDSMAKTRATYRQLFGEMAIPFDEAHFPRIYSPVWTKVYEQVGLPHDRWPDADRRWVQLYESEASTLVEGAADAIRALADSGVRLGLVTAGNRTRVELELRANGLEDAFATAVYGDAVPRQKPDPAPLQLAARYLRLEPRDLIYVGDATDDMLMGRRAGALPIGVLSGTAERRRLRSAGARWVAGSVGEVVRAAGRVGPARPSWAQRLGLPFP
jgi:phosphoglycolate phosphatase